MNNFLDRDISEMAFDRRVLDQINKDIPLGEKLFFIGVTFSNLTEFCMSRYPRKIKPLDEDDPIKGDLCNEILDVYESASTAFDKLNDEYHLIRDLNNISKKKKSKIEDYFKKDIYPTLQPKLVHDSTRLEPKSNEICIFVETVDEDDEVYYHNIVIPQMDERFIRIKKDTNIYFIEDIIRHHLDYIFKGYKVKKYITYSIQRSFNLIFGDEGDGIEDLVKKSLRNINKAWITRLEVDSSAPKSILKVLKNYLSLTDDTIIIKEKFIRLSDLKDFPMKTLDVIDSPRKFKRYNPFPKNRSIFDIIKEEDQLVYHPYESFDDTVGRLIKDAARDSNVISIKMTIYRVARKSKIIKYLLEAAENGKAVTVMVELKARFNEVDNLNISRLMREAGIDIIYSDETIKTHAKMCLITRKEKSKLRIYSHIGTGNYSEVNSKSYTDYSYFTRNSTIGEELTEFFNTITGSSKKIEATSFLHAPKTLRKNIVSLIKEQIKLAEDNKPAQIIMKCNGLTDEDTADWLYKASKAGVKITLYVRGACIIRPGVKKLSKNIEIYSIIGQYLEHSRVYVFGDKHDKVLIGSSDMMTRNLSNRNELLMYINDPKCKSIIIKHLDYFKKDTCNKYKILDDYNFKKTKSSTEYDVHKKLIKDAKKKKETQ